MKVYFLEAVDPLQRGRRIKKVLKVFMGAYRRNNKSMTADQRANNSKRLIKSGKILDKRKVTWKTKDRGAYNTYTPHASMIQKLKGFDSVSNAFVGSSNSAHARGSMQRMAKSYRGKNKGKHNKTGVWKGMKMQHAQGLGGLSGSRLP